MRRQTDRGEGVWWAEWIASPAWRSRGKYSAARSRWATWIYWRCRRSRPTRTLRNDATSGRRNRPRCALDRVPCRSAGDTAHCRWPLHRLQQQSGLGGYTVQFSSHWSTSINWDRTTKKTGHVIGRASRLPHSGRTHIRLSATSFHLTGIRPPGRPRRSVTVLWNKRN